MEINPAGMYNELMSGLLAQLPSHFKFRDGNSGDAESVAAVSAEQEAQSTQKTQAAQNTQETDFNKVLDTAIQSLMPFAESASAFESAGLVGSTSLFEAASLFGSTSVEAAALAGSTSVEAASLAEAILPVKTNAAAGFETILRLFAEQDEDSKVGKTINDEIAAAAEKFNVDPNLIKAVIRAESNFDPDAVSRSGAQGLMQLMPATAESLGVADPFDISDNINGGAQYLSKMLSRFGGDESLALAAYNAGAGAVNKYGGIPPYEETQKYVPKVIGYKEQYILEQYKAAANTSL